MKMTPRLAWTLMIGSLISAFYLACLRRPTRPEEWKKESERLYQRSQDLKIAEERRDLAISAVIESYSINPTAARVAGIYDRELVFKADDFAIASWSLIRRYPEIGQWAGCGGPEMAGRCYIVSTEIHGISAEATTKFNCHWLVIFDQAGTLTQTAPIGSEASHFFQFRKKP